jgi:cytochrome o ubiquinol oxidase subunit III
MMSSSSEHYPDAHHDPYSKTIFGFWVYLLTDFMLFATYFAAYVVLQKSTFGGPAAREILSLPHALIQTLLLLTCGLTSGCAGIFAHRKDKKNTLFFFTVTFVLGAFFLSLQIDEYTNLVTQGYTWKKSAFLTSYFNLLALHSIHVVFALLWIIVFIIPLWKKGITDTSLRRLTCLKMFWHFLTIVWIFIFTIVYLAGAHV